jgi:ATP-dependent DNA helicase RecG
MLELQTSVQYVRGIGPRIAEMLAEKGITTVEDLLYYLPFRYEDRINPRPIAQLKPGEMASVIAEVRTSGQFHTARTRTPLLQVTVADPGGRVPLKCVWFNASYLKDKFHPSQVVALYGKVEISSFGRGGLQMVQPQIEFLGQSEAGATPENATAESLETGRIVPIYESAGRGRLTTRWFRRAIHNALTDLAPDVPDAIPSVIRERLCLIPRREAFWQVHWPDAGERFADLQENRTPAHARLIFEELFFLELGLELKRKRARARMGIGFTINDRVRDSIKKILPFHPTAAQKRVLKEIALDMQRPSPMRRLLQGDVGSGKTIVAFQAAVIAIENGYQAALMAPTEILAMQHYLAARRMLEPLGYKIVLLTGSADPGRKRDLHRHISRGDAQLVIGTHALIQEAVEFARLGLVIVDEQHRFGVMQRFKLMRQSPAGSPGDSSLPPGVPNSAEDAPQVTTRRDSKALSPETENSGPDVIVMTATPIPRTLALTLYGDLDVSVIDELPPGRTPIITRRVVGQEDQAAKVWEFVRKQVKSGYQAYVVYPVIEETGNDDPSPADDPPKLPAIKQPVAATLKAAVQMYDKLRRGVFRDLRVGLLHGRLSAEEKEIAMARFQRGEIHILVATTVIEVGVDVANANIMVIEHAERFGLSQLHQLRGRIGRGAAKSYCVLMTGAKVSPEAEQRLEAMIRTTDGFEIAELDLQLRGPGEFFGTRQAGMPDLRVANLVRDREVLQAAKREASLVASGTSAGISAEDISRAVVTLRAHWQRRYGLVEVG